MNTYRKKLIEVDLPLDDINRESAREKRGSRHGHPSTLHRYWARRPLATCRAVIFASMVDDPFACPDEFPTDEAQAEERERLHDIIRRLVVWQNSNDENLLAEARYEIARSIARNKGQEAPTKPDAVLEYLRDHCPAIYDPFCGGGSIPLAAQRLGLNARGSDLNPLPVLITKAMIELPPQFHNQPPVNPDAAPNSFSIPWKGTTGLASDIRYYGAWVREEAHKRIGHLYPKVQLTDGSEAPVIAWVWARTVPCNNPACRIKMPLLKNFQISKKKSRQHWIRHIVNKNANTISWEVQNHKEGVSERSTVNRNGAFCIACGTAVNRLYIRDQAIAGNMEETMVAIVAEGNKMPLFVSPTDAHLRTALSAEPAWRPRAKLPDGAANLSVQGYGITEWHQLFTERQLAALTTFSDVLSYVRQIIVRDGGDADYASAVYTYLSLAVGRLSESSSMFTTWLSTGKAVVGTFVRQAIGMMWGFAEANPFSTSTQNWMNQIEWVANVVERLPAVANVGEVYQADAATTVHAHDGPVIVTDPPYYDNIGFADLSDFFYVWLRPLLRDIYPELFASMTTPKADEMIAAPRFEDSRVRFEELLEETLARLKAHCSPTFPTSIFYAYKQQEEVRDGKVSTGWETMLNSLVLAGFQIVGTWPMRTENTTRLGALGKNALASSIVLVCRPRPADAPVASRREFLDELKKAMPPALERFTREGHIAPVDLAQAAIGPGMEVYSRYSRVERVSGELVPVREALVYINRNIDAYYEQEEGDFDAETRFCLAWLKQYGYTEGRFGEAEVLATAKAVSIDNMARLLIAGGGIVQLRHPEGYYEEVKGEETHKVRAEFYLEGITTAWEGCLHMMFHLNLEGGKTIKGAAEVAAAMRTNSDCSPLSAVERLARLLYNHYDRQGDSANAVYFNNLVTSWDKIMSAMDEPTQPEMF